MDATNHASELLERAAVMKMEESGNTRKMGVTFNHVANQTLGSDRLWYEAIQAEGEWAWCRSGYTNELNRAYYTYPLIQPYRRYPALVPLAVDVHKLYW